MQKYSVTAAISLLLSCVLVLSTIFMSMPSTVIHPQDKDDFRLSVISLMPQSWPFFTKPPSDPELTAYSIENNTIVSASEFPNSKVDNLYGVSREQRAQGPELANLTNPVAPEHWVDCEMQRDVDCLLLAVEEEPVEIINDYPHQTLCGQVIISETRPVGFVNRDIHEGWRLDSRSLHLEVSC